LRLAGHEERAGLENRFAEEHARGDRRRRIMAAIEILLGPPSALGSERVAIRTQDTVDKEKRRAVRDQRGDFIGHWAVFLKTVSGCFF